MAIAIYASGEKGRQFLVDLLSRPIEVSEVCSYRQEGVADTAFDDIMAFCRDRGVRLHEGRRVDPGALAGAHVFVVGWQFLLPEDPRLVVFHDGLLPRYRGFAPTVAALINGEPRIGVTAIRPVAATDAGPIYCQRSVPVTYPLKIAAAFDLLAPLYVDCALEILGKNSAPVEQDHAAASFSIWRDDDDYAIDWSLPADRIARMVDAVGWPYLGARSGQIVIQDAAPVDDVRFETRQPGKLWSIEGGKPVVVCGSGMLRIDRAVDKAGEVVTFSKLRARLG